MTTDHADLTQRLAQLCDHFHTLYYDPPHRPWVEIHDRREELMRAIKNCILQIEQENQ